MFGLFLPAYALVDIQLYVLYTLLDNSYPYYNTLIIPFQVVILYLQMLDTPEERAKFETLYHAHRRTMLHIAMQILKDHQLAEDAVQEAFLRLVKNFSKIGQINCPRTRLFTVIIVRNISLTMLAERKKETVLESPDAVIPIEYDLEEDVLERIAYEEVLNAIRELPVLYRFPSGD